MSVFTKPLEQEGHHRFIKLLTKVREGDFDEEVDKSLLLRFVAKGMSNYLQ